MDSLDDRVIKLPVRQEALSVDAVFEDMLTGWRQQQLAGNFTSATIRGRKQIVSAEYAIRHLDGGPLQQRRTELPPGSDRKPEGRQNIQ
ncbi:hypothetical protein FEF26_14145 [Nesterenkonia salmonea]|uniref:Uncharacterized protein n=1 Tax=Nesterenkonia salmonea TaxID=1804987 RepID=A0A5R9B9R8_9MICC|nr:hypothetical protein [Nesterenkonia salmonea]TLP92918.1 hypothetical protein FEF26_14145 [Nesterenkonia salmonea]